MLLTDQVAATRDLADLLDVQAVDPEAARTVRDIARRLSVRRRRRTPDEDGGPGARVATPFRYRSDDIDLERTVEALLERPVPEVTDILVREQRRERRSVVLVVDVSGSVRGEKLRTAVATVAALHGELAGDQLAVVAFWSDAALLKPFGQSDTTEQLLDRLLRIPARGLTNLFFGLATARAELLRTAVRRRTVVLLTDAVHNAGPDPRLLAPRFAGLHVLLQTDGEHDAPLAADLARLGHGRYHRVASSRDVAPALNRVFGRRR